MQKTKNVLYMIAAYATLVSGFRNLDLAADQHNVFRLITGFVYLLVGVIGIWVFTNVERE